MMRPGDSASAGEATGRTNPSVSLVVLNWNGREHLGSCLDSLAALDYPRDRLQLILCDNGSTDGSVDFVRNHFPNVEVVALDQNYGFAEGNNRAAEHATGEWLGFLNNDMHVEAGWIGLMLAPLNDRPNLACVSSRILNWDGSAVDFVGGGVNFQGHGFQPDHGLARSDHDHARPLLFACGGAMMLRRDCFVELGGFDADYFAFFEDVDLGWRLNLLGYDVWYAPEATVYHRHHGTADRVPAHKLRLLYERNALFTIYKCFDDENLAAALPASLMLLNEKALRIAHFDPEPFRLAPASRDTNGPQTAGTAAAGSRITEGVAAKAIRLTREEGFEQMTRKAARLFRWKWDVFKLRIRLALHRPRGGHTLPLVSVSHYAALSEFSHSLNGLQEKRQWLQSRRVRSDAELLPLFHNALDPSYNDLRYIEFHRWLCHVLQLDQRFKAGER